MITYKLRLSIGINNASHEHKITIDELGYTEKEWNALSEDLKEENLQNYWKDWINNYIVGGWSEVK